MPLRVTTTAIVNVAVLSMGTAKFIAGIKNEKPAEVESCPAVRYSETPNEEEKKKL